MIAQLSKAKKHRLWIPATNDHNEALGSLRVDRRRAPGMSIGQHNSHTMYRWNGGGGFKQTHLSGPADSKNLQAQAQRDDASGAEKKRRLEQAQHDQDVVDSKQQRNAERKEKADEDKAILDALIPRLNPHALRVSGSQMLASEIVLHINWHWRHDTNIPSKTLIHKMKKSDKLIQLIITVEKFVRFSSSAIPEELIKAPESIIEAAAPLEWEEIQDIEDADMEE